MCTHMICVCLCWACRHFGSLCYTADGRTILAGGRSKFVCIYNVEHQILLKKFQISRNRSLDGVEVRNCHASVNVLRSGQGVEGYGQGVEG